MCGRCGEYAVSNTGILFQNDCSQANSLKLNLTFLGCGCDIYVDYGGISSARRQISMMMGGDGDFGGFGHDGKYNDRNN